jgi:Flp pilus assembly protein TadG
MPILMMALLALIIFGLIGILLTAATVLEHRAHAHAGQGAAGLSATTSMTSGAASSLKPKHL